MYYTHPYVAEPTGDSLLWRYMDLAKFIHLLEFKALHLAALKTFEDPFEGHPPRSVIASMTKEPQNLSPEESARRLAIIENNLVTFKNSRNGVFASCWHMNETESAGMWAQYIRTGEGIAIQTTFERLKSSIELESPDVAGAVVQYVDFETYEPNELNVLVWGALKRASYSHEREFRLVALDQPGPSGLSISVDVTQLIERVYVAPTTPNWLQQLVESLLSRYQLNAPLSRSDLLDAPDYFVVPPWAKSA